MGNGKVANCVFPKEGSFSDVVGKNTRRSFHLLVGATLAFQQPAQLCPQAGLSDASNTAVNEDLVLLRWKPCDGLLKDFYEPVPVRELSSGRRVWLT
jgi:hypothetical protein